ncbi:sodium:proton antiporter [Actinoplanes sp. SE50]|uniref:Na+/H+ antiporter NhaA n=1 Tax=unclassified Actinoplanes TaxID=2626549 RepID=UPI00023EC618|nr:MULTISPECIES: Na+/H+ antiporter NhaA [unclassified Actinoplanes]AEV84668.1 Na(+)/H(+) antiporter nhaA 1 [Actinoplanes sp. SE50/110]ATO83060.1 sodium:proton antiporter [Actinoplanes sp. SE50]SLM00467.1 Na(+)/H(+) antiporter NhaA [Actinoplanes sp. SE50/110]
MSAPPSRPRRPLFGRGSWPEVSRIGDILRAETVGGALLLCAAVIALIWANSPWSAAYQALVAARAAVPALHLDLTLAQWASDGLLAIFFFVAGLELKREFVAGDLRDPRRAALPVAAALGGMAAPALIYTAVNVTAAGGVPSGWAVPTATDIAFALAVLGVIATHLPAALRTFLLTLAVVDDLLAIVIIAVFYTDALHPLPLLAALLPLAGFAVLVQRRVRAWWLLLPLAAATWVLVHASGVHATVAGVLLGFAVPVVRRAQGPGPGLAEHFEHRWRPLSAGVAVPLFAFFAAGVPLAGAGGLGATLRDPVTLGIAAGLIAGKCAGVFGATWLVQRTTRASLDDGVSWWDVFGLALLAGIGFTVSLLIGELAFGAGSVTGEHARIGILAGSVTAALLASVVLRLRNRHYRRLCAAEAVDTDADGVPDVYQHDAHPEV